MGDRRLELWGIALPIAGLLLGGGVFLVDGLFSQWVFDTYCAPSPTHDCYDEVGNNTYPTWAATIEDVLYYVPYVVVALAALAAVALGARALSHTRRENTGRGMAIASIVLGVIVFVPTALTLALIGVMSIGGGPHGRPLRIAGRASRGRSRRMSSPWSEGPTPRSTGIDAITRAQLASEWLADARLEHSAIAAFCRLSRDLIAAGAPPALSEASTRAAADEVRHARTCFALASAYAGEALAPDALPEARVPTFPRSRRGLLRTLLRESVIDGCIGEGAAARSARVSADRAVDPVVAQLLTVLSDEEAEHAQLGYAIVAWARAELGPESESIVAEALREAARERVDLPDVDHDLERHGRPSRATLRRARDEAIEAFAPSVVRAA